MIRSTLLCLCFAQASLFVAGQSLSNCHHHDDVEYCVGPDGKDVPVTTHISASVTTSGPVSAAASTTAAAQTTAVTDCHLHETQTVCVAGNGDEVEVTGSAKATGTPPSEFTDCHSHGEERFCLGPDGDEFAVRAVSESHEHESEEEETSSPERNCHFHAGVEHCTGGDESEGSSQSCDRVDRDYNIPYRVGSLFVILVTSSIAVFGPILWARFFSSKMNILAFTVIKQFGTGIMVSTAFVHLLTHAQLMFSSECLGVLDYEATTTGVVMAGLFLTFLVEYTGNRVMLARYSSPKSNEGVEPTCETECETEPQACKDHPVTPALANLGHNHHTLDGASDKLSVAIMEAGIVFHSVILGVTLVVSGDSGYTPLFIVIIFHQMFEGLALGSRIAELTKTKTSTKVIMATIYSLITPLGMAIGLGVIHDFNGNARSTIIVIGTLDALSAGILAWAAIVDMWCHDWIHGDMKNAGLFQTVFGLLALVIGMVLMGVLGKWA